MSSLRTSYDFTLPRGYVDDDGGVHRKGTMRLATARDELAPLRDPTVQGPDDPRLTILVLTRVIESLGTLEQVNSYVVEGLFAVDLAFLQDFYGVINFGNQEEFEALIAAQESTSLVGTAPAVPAAAPEPASYDEGPGAGASPDAEPEPEEPPMGRRSLRQSVEEMPRRTT